jgi:hypothetical protein
MNWWDKVKGAIVAFVDNATGGLVNLRDKVSYTDASDYNNGQNFGDAASIVIGASMIYGGGEQIKYGTAIASSSLAVEFETGGTSTVPAIGGAGMIVSGTLNVAMGLVLEAQGTKNLKDQKGRLPENKGNPKKEARERAKEIRDQQPDSENYANYKAKELEKAKGKDARRKAHDAKDKGGPPNRTRKELDEDYNINSR